MLYPGIGLVVFIIDIYCIYLIFTGSGDTGMKLVWLLVILFLPVVGAILYLLLGRGNRAI